MRLALLFSLIVLLPQTAYGYGETDGAGRPNLLERQLHLLTNQVRAAPHQFQGWDHSSATGEARPPLAFDTTLFDAARFHAADMATSGCFQHTSCDGTSFQQRLARFFDGLGAGENIARGSPSPEAVMVGWMNSSGHRRNILDPTWNVLGTGTATGRHWVQNFGLAPNAEIPRIVSAAPFPSGATLELAAHAYSPAGQAPLQFDALVGAERVSLAPSVGSAGNRVWTARTANPSDCQTLVFELEDSFGERHHFPTTGALLVGASCTKSFEGSVSAPEAEDGRRVVSADPGTEGCRCSASNRSRSSVLFGLLFAGLLAQLWRRREI